MEESSSGRERVSIQFDILSQMIQGDVEFPERTFQIPHIMPACDRCPESAAALGRSSTATGQHSGRSHRGCRELLCSVLSTHVKGERVHAPLRPAILASEQSVYDGM